LTGPPSGPDLSSPPAFTLPAALLSGGFQVRPETEADVAFLRSLYASTRAEEMAKAPWSEAQKAHFLGLQFDAQRAHYRGTMPDAQYLVIEHRGAPIGRLYLDRGQEILNLVDIAFMPAWRGQGIGGQIMDQVLALADQERRVTVLFVERFNRALNLYRRLGFSDVRDHDIYLEMERAPG